MNGNRKRSIHNSRYKAAIDVLVKLRKDQGLSQSDVASEIGLSQSDVSKIEHCERRLDIIEFLDVLQTVSPNYTDKTLLQVLKNTSL
jgi:transcriptional regulator with XRE-family HTH domain